MVRWNLIIATASLLALSGCIANAVPDPSEVAPGATLIDESIRLDLDGTGWARYEIVAPAGAQVEVELMGPPEYDLCQPFFSDTHDMPQDHFTTVALLRTNDEAGASWYLFHPMPWGWPNSAGDMDCGKGTLMLGEGERAAVIVGTTMTGMSLEIRINDAPPGHATSAALSAHPGLVRLQPEAERTEVADAGLAFVGIHERWTTETAGGPRVVVAMAWQMEQESTPVQLVHAELQSGGVSLHGIDEPFAETYGPSPGFGFGSWTGGAWRPFGYASGAEPVVAISERETHAGAVTGTRSAGLTVWEFPLVAYAES